MAEENYQVETARMRGLAGGGAVSGVVDLAAVIAKDASSEGCCVVQ